MGDERYKTWSGLPVERVYEADGDARSDSRAKLGTPGAYPFTRGTSAGTYRDKPWITRNLAGLLSPQASNERLKYLAERGQTGFALVPDMPTQLGVDGDHPMAAAAVGTQGVPLTSIADMEAAFDGLPMDVTTASFSIPGTSAPVIMAQYLLTANRRGVPREKIRGSIQNDPIQARFCCYDAGTPLDLALRVCIDTIEFSVRNLPNWHPVTINAYDLRESGINAFEEMGFALAIAFAYIDELCRRGLSVDQFAHRIPFICGVHIDIFEEAAKFRAARRVWAHTLKNRYGASKERTMALKLAAHSCGSSLTSQEPINNVIRGAYEALAAILGGVQALDLSCYDEGVAIPSEMASAVALKTQQILALETGVANTADPLGGSYFFESLTDRIEQEIVKLIAEIDERGGMVKAAESGWFPSRLQEANQRLQAAIDSGEKKVGGVNVFNTPGEYDRLVPIKSVHLKPCAEQVERVRRFKQDRDLGPVKTALRALHDVARRKQDNLLPNIIAATEAAATVGEIVGTMRVAYGKHYDPFDMIECPWIFS
ncbi:MAG: methylmalonyl-CoA mutase family protein [Candidatus Binataceae bacterium]